MEVKRTIKITDKNIAYQIIKNELAILGKGGTSIASIEYKSESSGELARHTGIVGLNHKQLLEKDLQNIDKIKAKIHPILVEKYGVEIADKVFEEKEKSLRTSIDGTNERSKAMKKAFVQTDSKGLKVGLGGINEYYLTLYVISRKVLIEGEHKVVKSKDLTLGKRLFEKEQKATKIRTFKLTADNLKALTVRKIRFEFDLK